jgi:hypothetical protein
MFRNPLMQLKSHQKKQFVGLAALSLLMYPISRNVQLFLLLTAVSRVFLQYLDNAAEEAHQAYVRGDNSSSSPNNAFERFPPCK